MGEGGELKQQLQWEGDEEKGLATASDFHYIQLRLQKVETRTWLTKTCRTLSMENENMGPNTKLDDAIIIDQDGMNSYHSLSS